MRETVRGFVQKELAPYADEIDRTDDWQKRKVGSQSRLRWNNFVFLKATSEHCAGR